MCFLVCFLDVVDVADVAVGCRERCWFFGEALFKTSKCGVGKVSVY